MRTKHASHSLPAFPVYSCAFVSPNELVLGGGGGQTRSGIKNKLVLRTTVLIMMLLNIADSLYHRDYTASMMKSQ